MTDDIKLMAEFMGFTNILTYKGASFGRIGGSHVNKDIPDYPNNMKALLEVMVEIKKRCPEFAES